MQQQDGVLAVLGEFARQMQVRAWGVQLDKAPEQRGQLGTAQPGVDCHEINRPAQRQALFQPPKSPKIVDIGRGSESFVFHILNSELERIGFAQVRRCLHCKSVFFRTGRRKFFSRRCMELEKGRRYTTSPDYNEYHAFLMWKNKLKNLHQSVGETRVKNWLCGYRKKLKKKGLSVSKRRKKYYLGLIQSDGG